MKYFFIILCLALSFSTKAQSILGTWKTIDDKDGVEKSYVEVYESSNKVYGKVIKLLKEPADKLCEKCKGERKDKPVMGMTVIDGLSKVKDYYGNGRIYDPVTGNDYGCSIWIEKNSPNELKVRGKHWTGLYRTQTWYRVM